MTSRSLSNWGGISKGNQCKRHWFRPGGAGRNRAHLGCPASLCRHSSSRPVTQARKAQAVRQAPDLAHTLCSTLEELIIIVLKSRLRNRRKDGKLCFQMGWEGCVETEQRKQRLIDFGVYRRCCAMGCKQVSGRWRPGVDSLKWEKRPFL